MAPISPTVARWELTLRLRQRREQLGIDVNAIIKALGFNRPYWSHLEKGRRILSADKLVRLLEILEVDADEQKELIALRTAAKERGWWSDYSALISEDALRFYGLEHGAQSIRTFESLLIPGLLQTEDYARALITADPVFIRQTDVAALVQVRRRRQQRLLAPDPLELTAVISQAALLQQTGGPDVLRGQLLHLATLIDEHPDTIDVRVIPYEATGGAVLGGSTFRLIDFADARLPTLAWQEAVVTLEIIEDESKVLAVNLAHAHAQSIALSKEDSLDMIKQCARG